MSLGFPTAPGCAAEQGLDEVRRLLGHESLSTTLRYNSLVNADLQRAHRKAGTIERLH